MKRLLQCATIFFVIFSVTGARADMELPEFLQWDLLDWVSGAGEPAAAQDESTGESAAVTQDQGVGESAAAAQAQDVGEAAASAQDQSAGASDDAVAGKAADAFVFVSNTQPVPPTDKPGQAVLAAASAGPDVVGEFFSPDGKADCVVRIAVKEPEASVVSLRIDNLGGKAARWQSEIAAGAMPMAVFHDGTLLNPEGASFSLPGANGDGEQIFAVAIQDNGAIEAGTKLRLTIFLDNKQRRYASIEMDSKGE
jgi:hypothetical protein